MMGVVMRLLVCEKMGSLMDRTMPMPKGDEEPEVEPPAVENCRVPPVMNRLPKPWRPGWKLAGIWGVGSVPAAGVGDWKVNPGGRVGVWGVVPATAAEAGPVVGGGTVKTGVPEALGGERVAGWNDAWADWAGAREAERRVRSSRGSSGWPGRSAFK